MKKLFIFMLIAGIAVSNLISSPQGSIREQVGQYNLSHANKGNIVGDDLLGTRKVTFLPVLKQKLQAANQLAVYSGLSLDDAVVTYFKYQDLPAALIKAIPELKKLAKQNNLPLGLAIDKYTTPIVLSQPQQPEIYR